MATTACFVIVGRNDSPVYESEVGSAPKVSFASERYLKVLHDASQTGLALLSQRMEYVI